MADVANKRLNIYIEDQAAQLTYKKLQTEQDKLTQKITEGQKAGKAMTTELLKLDKVNAQIKDVQKQLDNGLKPSLTQQTQLVRQLNAELKRLSENDPQFASKLENYKKQNAELQRMQQNVSGVTQATSGMGSSLIKAAASVGLMVTAYAAFQGVKQFLSDAVAEAEAAEQANSRLKNTLENIGRLDVFDRLQKKANDLAGEFKFLDNDDLVEAEQKLITYGKLTEKQIDDLLPVIVNFAAKSRISLEESSSVIIKALEGSAKGLKEYGINVKDGSDVTERMSILMKDLAPRVDGAAKAFGETLAGSAAIAKQELANVEEEVGNKLTPVLTGFYKVLAQAIEGITIAYDKIKASFDAAARGFSIVKSYLTLNFAEAEAKKQAIRDTNTRIEQEKELGNVQLQVSSIVKDAATKTVAEQEKIIQQNIALRNASNETYKQLRDAGKLNTAEGQKAKLQLIQDFEVVKQLQASLKAQQDKTTLGFGSDDPKAKTKTDKAAEDAKKLQEKINADYERMFAEFIDHINKLSKDEFDYAFNKILEDAKKKAAEITAEFGKDTPRTNTLLTLLGKSSFGDVQKLVSQQRPGVKSSGIKPEELPVRLNFLDNADLDASVKGFQERLKTLGQETGTYFGQGFQTGLSEFINSDDFRAGIQNLQGITDIASSFAQAKTNSENASFAKEVKINDRRKQEYKRLLDQKLISQSEYNNKVAAIDRAQDKKKAELEKTQFERNRKIQIAQAIINGALAVTNALATVQPFYAAVIAAAITVAKTAAEISVINSQKPQFAKGGKLTGPSHANGGMPVINPNTGRTEAEVEGGEYILSKSTVRNNRHLADQLLYSSMYNGGASLQPNYKTRAYMPVDYSGITASYTRMKYATGGVVQPATTTTNIPPEVAQQSNDRIEAVLNAIVFHLQNPVRPVVGLSQIKDADTQLATIKAQANFRQS